jgi:uncharacterized oxidoreductase
MNVLFNNAGILPDETAVRIDDNPLIDSLATNPMGPVSMSSALIGHLKRQDDAVIVYTSSILGFVSLVFTALCSATKAALHAYASLQRFLLKGTDIRLLEWSPEVRTDLINGREAEQTMPLDRFIAETMAVFATDANEILGKVRGPSALMSAPTNVLSLTPLTRRCWRLPKTADR